MLLQRKVDGELSAPLTRGAAHVDLVTIEGCGDPLVRLQHWETYDSANNMVKEYVRVNVCGSVSWCPLESAIRLCIDECEDKANCKRY